MITIQIFLAKLEMISKTQQSSNINFITLTISLHKDYQIQRQQSSGQIIKKPMGNSTQKPPLPSQLQKVSDGRYGGSIMLDSHKTKAYQIFDLDFSNAQTFSKLLKQRKQLSHQNLITVNRTWVDDYRQNCSLQKMHRVTVEYKYIQQCLEDEIRKYCDLRRPVPENLVKKYFTGVVSCLEYLKTKGTCHGDIKPKNIMIGKDGKAYLADSFFMNGGRIAFQIVMQDPQSLSLLSPTQLQSLRNKKFISLKQVHEDEMFAVGLSMMETMTAQPAMQCYDLANLKLKPEFFKRKYSQMISCQYSPQLCQLVMQCVQFVPENRIKFNQFLETINSILANQNDFQPQNQVMDSRIQNTNLNRINVQPQAPVSPVPVPLSRPMPVVNNNIFINEGNQRSGQFHMQVTNPIRTHSPLNINNMGNGNNVNMSNGRSQVIFNNNTIYNGQRVNI